MPLHLLANYHGKLNDSGAVSKSKKATIAILTALICLSQQPYSYDWSLVGLFWNEYQLSFLKYIKVTGSSKSVGVFLGVNY